MSFTPPPNNPTSPPPAPSRQDDDENFDIKANAMVAWYAIAIAWFTSFVTWTRTFIGELNTAMTTILQAKQTAIDQADLAMGYRNQAGNSATSASGSASTATTKAGEASTSAGQAAASASASNSAKLAAEAARDQTYTFGSAMLLASSTTSLVLDTNDKDLTIETGKAFGPGMRLVLASAADPIGFQMQGYVKSYNKDTGALSLRILSATGSGSKADWKIGISGGDSGNLPVVVVTANSNIQPNVCYIVAAANIVLTLVGSWKAGDRLALREVIDGTYSLQLSSIKVRGIAPPAAWTVRSTRGSLDMTYFDETRGLV